MAAVAVIGLPRVVHATAAPRGQRQSQSTIFEKHYTTVTSILRQWGHFFTARARERGMDRGG